MSATPDSTLANPEQLISNLQRKLAEREAELAEARQQQTATAEVLGGHCQVASSGGAMGKTSSAGFRLQAQLRPHRATCRRRHGEPCDSGWH